MEELVHQMEEQLGRQEEAVRAAEGSVAGARQEKGRLDGMVREEEAKLKKVRDQVRKVNGLITNLRNEEENEAPVDIAALEDDQQVKEEEIEKMKDAIGEEEAKLAELIEAHKTAKRVHEEVRQENENKQEAIAPLTHKLEGLEAAIKKARKDTQHYQAKLEEYRKRISECEVVVGEKQAVVDAAVARARDWSEERVETRKKVDSLRREIVKMEESLARQEETQESREVVTAEFTRLKESFVKVDGQVKSMSKTVDYLGCMLDTRKNGFKHILRSTSKKINWNFTLQLSARNYVGKLDFNHKDKVLLIVVNPDSRASAAALDVQRDIRSLSGGEKSYSSVSFILALWESMNPPFRVLDEFDVFMDAVNRR